MVFSQHILHMPHFELIHHMRTISLFPMKIYLLAGNPVTRKLKIDKTFLSFLRVSSEDIDLLKYLKLEV